MSAIASNFHRNKDASSFFNFRNNLRENINFTLQLEANNSMSFLESKVIGRIKIIIAIVIAMIIVIIIMIIIIIVITMIAMLVYHNDN